MRLCRFEMLAFKSDVSHWRKRDELVGVSLRCVGIALMALRC